jgi:hypothetical protein
MEPKRKDAAEPQTEAAASAVNELISACDERARSAAERAWSEGKQGKRPMARSAERRARWSRRHGVGLQMLKIGCPISSPKGEKARCACAANGRVVQTASVCGRRAEVERRRNGVSCEAEPERNGTAEPQTEATTCAVNQESSAREERGLCGAEQAWSRREAGPRPVARGAEQSPRWSRRGVGE